MDSRIIRASGFWNMGLAITLFYPPLYLAMGLNLTQPVWGWMLAGFALYTGIILILGSRDLRIFGGIILWEGVLRFLGAAILTPAGLFFEYGWIVVVLGLTDLAWGIVFFAIVPRRTGLSVRDLLTGRRG
jgi:hypothetical protein